MERLRYFFINTLPRIWPILGIPLGLIVAVSLDAPFNLIGAIVLILALFNPFSENNDASDFETDELLSMGEDRALIDEESDQYKARHQLFEFVAPLGNRLRQQREVSFGLKGGDHIAYFIFSEDDSYLNTLIDIALTGASNPNHRELVLLFLQNEHTLNELMKKNSSTLVESPNFKIRLLSQLRQEDPEIGFFDNIDGFVSGLVDEIYQENNGEVFDGIRLVADDLTPLYRRSDFRRIKDNFNRKLEDYLATFEYLRDVPFTSLGTYRTSSFALGDNGFSSKLNEEIRSVLIDHHLNKTLVFTEKNEVLDGNEALRYLLKNDDLWGGKEASKPVMPA